VASIRALDGVFLAWGETARWDDARQRLYCVDCATHVLGWLEGGEPPLHTMAMPSMPTGAALATDGRLVVALDGGLHVVDVDAGSLELLAPYPNGLGDRANDLNADGEGNLVTGTLNLADGPGSYWWYSATEGWRLLDDDGIGNANGPVVLDLAGRRSLVFADTRANRLYAYAYEGRGGQVGPRRVFADTAGAGGSPDGACADAAGGVWSCLLGPGRLVRYQTEGETDTIEVGVSLPSDVTFGGPDLATMFVTTIASGPDPASAEGGQVFAVENSGFRGLPEPRFSL